MGNSVRAFWGIASVVVLLVGCGGGDDDSTGNDASTKSSDDPSGFCPSAAEINQALGLHVQFHSRINDICGYGPSADVEDVDISYEYDVTPSDFADEGARLSAAMPTSDVGDAAYVITNIAGQTGTMLLALQGTTEITLVAPVPSDTAIAYMKTLLGRL
jgi:hypothetical protein